MALARHAQHLKDIAKPHYQRQRGNPRYVADYSKGVGCRGVSTSCLACPLSRCLEELPTKRQREEVRARLLKQQGERPESHRSR
jgi:hypothetical protein